MYSQYTTLFGITWCVYYNDNTIILCKNNDRLLLFSSLGKFYTINCSKINTGRGFGDPISLMIDKNDNG